MPLADPTLAMRVDTAQAPSTLANPLALVTGIAQARKTMAEAGMEQQSLAAHQEAGQIFATSPDAPTAIKRLMANPLTSSFAPELAQNWAGTQNALLAAQSTTQSMATNAFGMATKALVSGIHDPSMLDSTLQGITSFVAPAARGQVTQAFGALKKGLMQGLPTNPDGTLTDAGKAEYQKRLSDTYTSFAGSADAIYGATGNVKPSIGVLQGFGPSGGNVVGYMGGPPTGPETVGAVSQPSGAPGPESINPEQQAEQTATGQVVGGLKKEMSSAASVIPIEAKRINLLRDALKSFAPGGGMEGRGQIAQSMQALQKIGFDIPNSAIDAVAGGSLQGLQYFNQQIKQAAINQLRIAAEGLGRTSAHEINNAIDSLSIDNDPKMLIEDLNKAMYGLRYQHARIQKFNEMSGLTPAELKSKYGISDLSQFNGWFNDNMPDNKMPTETGGGVFLGDVDPSEIKEENSRPAGKVNKTKTGVTWSFGASK